MYIKFENINLKQISTFSPKMYENDIYTESEYGLLELSFPGDAHTEILVPELWRVIINIFDGDLSPQQGRVAGIIIIWRSHFYFLRDHSLSPWDCRVFVKSEVS